MVERLHQFRFDESFQPAPPQDVTPAQFPGLRFPRRTDEVHSPLPSPAGRFVRELNEQVFITSPAEAAHYLLTHVFTPFDRFDQEELWVLLLNNKNRITHEVMVYRGTINTMTIRMVELFKEAVRVNASGLIFSHNHPSGDPTPSPNDVETTKSAKAAADLLGIGFEDHIIVGKDRWVSLREKGLGFE